MEEPEVRVKPVTGVGRDLYQLSIGDLESYVGELEAEIARKRAMRGAAEALFRRPPDGPKPD